MRRFIVIFEFLGFLLQGISVHGLFYENMDFRKSFTGVTFAPYIANGDFSDKPRYTHEHPFPPLDSYTLEDVTIMLTEISTRFDSITTYNMGVNYKNKNISWERADSSCLVARAAAQINQENKELKIKMALGVHSNDPRVLTREIENGLLASKEANTIHPGTVWGLVVMTQRIDSDTVKQLRKMLTQFKNQTKDIGLKIGTRIYNCADILKGGWIARALKRIAISVDFIMCSQYAIINEPTNRPEAAANLVTKRFKNYTTAFRAVNRNLEMILGETGWSSKRKGDSTENMENMKKYWIQIGKNCNELGSRCFLYEAFDEPWKSYEPLVANYPTDFEVEGSFGWWRRVYNKEKHSIIEKIYENITIQTKKPASSSPSYTEKIPDEILNPEKGVALVSNLPLLFGIIISVILLISIALIVFLLRRLSHNKETNDQLTDADIEEFEVGISPKLLTNDEMNELALFLPYNRSFEIEKDKLLIDKDDVLGKGVHGIAYKGKIQGFPDSVVFKTAKPPATGKRVKSILSELKIMIHIGKHENIIGLIGAYTAEIREEVYIVSEYCALGSLEKYLRKYTESSASAYTNLEDFYQCSVLQLIQWSREIANGMAWLAAKNVIHADLATRNILLSANKTVKISDFGLSRKLYEYNKYMKKSQEPLPWRWMAIESLKSLKFSEKSDIWAYGVTLWEMFTFGDIPYGGLNWHVQFLPELERGFRLNCPKYASKEIYNKILECWRHNPVQRPNFSELVPFFEKLETEVHVGRNKQFQRQQDVMDTIKRICT